MYFRWRSAKKFYEKQFKENEQKESEKNVLEKKENFFKTGISCAGEFRNYLCHIIFEQYFAKKSSINYSNKIIKTISEICIIPLPENRKIHISMNNNKCTNWIKYLFLADEITNLFTQPPW